MGVVFGAAAGGTVCAGVAGAATTALGSGIGYAAECVSEEEQVFSRAACRKKVFKGAMTGAAYGCAIDVGEAAGQMLFADHDDDGCC